LVGFGVIDQDAAHGERRDRHKVGAILQSYIRSNQPKIRLMDQRGWTQGMIGPFTMHVTSGYRMHLGVHEGHQPVLRSGFTALPSVQ
jgi:hypothetical protein